MNNLRAIGYVRVSTDDQVENGTSLDDQKERCLSCAKLRGATVVRICEDAGVSGAKYEHRPGVQEAINLIESGEADLLIVSDISRLGRKMKVLTDIAERVDRAGGQIVSCDGQEYGGSPNGRLMLNMLGSFAEFERDNIRDRSERGHVRRAIEGKQPNRSIPPYGFTIVTEADIKAHQYDASMAGKYVVIEEKAVWVREMFDRFAGGYSLRQLEKWLTNNNVPTPKGGAHWYAKTIALILSNSVYKGSAVFRKTRTYHDESLLKQGFRSDVRKKVRPEEEWILIPIEPMIPESIWNLCQEQLKRNKTMFGGNRDRKFMLSSMVYCPHCGWKMAGWNRTNRQKLSPVYLCHNEYAECNRKSIPTSLLERTVVDVLLWVAKNPESIALAIDAYDDFNLREASLQPADERKRLEAELADIERDLEVTKQTMKAAMRNGLREKDFDSDFGLLAERRNRVESRLSEITVSTSRKSRSEPKTEAEKHAAVIEAVKTVLTASEADYSATDKQRIIANIVDRIEPTFDRTQVSVTLRTQTVYTINAAYWYRRAGKPTASGSLDIEWAEIAEELLAG